MYVLGIETSCDETSAAVVKDGRQILSNVVSSSIKFHARYGGVIPEIASRMQLETITQVVDSAVKDAGVKLADIKLVSVTENPGLTGSLLVGTSFAKAISFSLNIPLLGIDHTLAHVYAAVLSAKQPVRLPFASLVVSGGHTSLFYLKDFDSIITLGETQDDACGEAFDKVAKILKLGYPGGPLIEELAKKGNPQKIKFRCSGTKNPLGFSFSGIKTAVLYCVKQKKMTRQFSYDIAASFQEAVTDVLVEKSLLACRLKKINRLLIGGGVAANNYLRDKFFRQAKKQRLEVSFPSRELCLDNAAMVAGLGYQLYKKGNR